MTKELYCFFIETLDPMLFIAEFTELWSLTIRSIMLSTETKRWKVWASRTRRQTRYWI